MPQPKKAESWEARIFGNLENPVEAAYVIDVARSALEAERARIVGVLERMKLDLGVDCSIIEGYSNVGAFNAAIDFGIDAIKSIETKE